MKSTKAVGDEGENKAASYLSSHGYTIIARNWRTRNGELDIVAHKGNVAVFVEVKSFPHGNADTLEYALNAHKRAKIIETSKRFLSCNRQYSKDYVRFDVIVVDTPGFPEVYHIENAFTE